ncbi:amino acid permease [Micavibrio aeruginosavorus]|uniref:amino acid permease n=1 Tax=Micavibrio aeruginosavorus TaxID=349221 RepID=UPI003F4ACC00
MSSDTQPPKSEKSIGVVAATALVVGNVVGAGFFLSPAALAPYGSVALIGWVVMCMAAMCLGLVFARLGRIVPASGGPYGYARMGFGDFAGFLVAWGYWISVWASLPAIALAFIGYLRIFVPALHAIPHGEMIVALGIMWAVALLNMSGVKRVGQAQILLVGVKIIPFLAIAICGLFWSGWDNLKPLNPSDVSFPLALAATFPLTMFAFLGIESATVPADSIKNPKKTIPYATMIGVMLAAVIYIFGTLAVMKAIPRETLMQSASPFADAATVMWGSWGGYVIAFAALLSSLGALNGWTLLMSQVPMAAARDHVLPKIFSDLNRFGVPGKGIALSMALSSAVLIMQSTAVDTLMALYDFIVQLSTVSGMIPYVFCCLVEGVLFLRMNPASRAYRIGPYMPIAMVGFIFSMLTIYGSGPMAGMWALLLLLAGIPLYVAMQSGKQNT